jgi:hypothetical protein
VVEVFGGLGGGGFDALRTECRSGAAASVLLQATLVNHCAGHFLDHPSWRSLPLPLLAKAVTAASLGVRNVNLHFTEF